MTAKVLNFPFALKAKEYPQAIGRLISAGLPEPAEVMMFGNQNIAFEIDDTDFYLRSTPKQGEYHFHVRGETKPRLLVASDTSYKDTVLLVKAVLRAKK